jgi:hypothetical protein
MRVILINIEAGNQVLYAPHGRKLALERLEWHKKPNFRHKKPRSFDQGLCYRLEVNQRLSS